MPLLSFSSCYLRIEKQSARPIGAIWMPILLALNETLDYLLYLCAANKPMLNLQTNGCDSSQKMWRKNPRPYIVTVCKINFGYNQLLSKFYRIRGSPFRGLGFLVL